MVKTFYIADLHFGHKNVIKYDNRPFLSVEEMDDVLIENWNHTVGVDDTVYVLGDISWYDYKRTVEIMQQLKGKKILIKGNHDKLNQELKNCFEYICDYKEIKDNGRDVILCHYPIPCFNKHFYGSIHLYGHVHNSFEANMMEHFKQEMADLYEKQCNMFNVGVMMPWMNYTPRTLDEILEGYNKG